jgi:hypothetical protein
MLLLHYKINYSDKLDLFCNAKVKMFNVKNISLCILSLLHALLGISSLIFFILFSFGIHNVFIDILVTCIIVSFVITQRCIHIDFTNVIQNEHSDIPEYCKDGFIFKNIFGIENDLKEHRLDILSKDLPNTDTHIFNVKIHYIVTNISLLLLLLVKYRQQKFIPLVLLWFYIVFPI